jgi:hypothetical protein
MFGHLGEGRASGTKRDTKLPSLDYSLEEACLYSVLVSDTESRMNPRHGLFLQDMSIYDWSGGGCDIILTLSTFALKRLYSLENFLLTRYRIRHSEGDERERSAGRDHAAINTDMDER